MKKKTRLFNLLIIAALFLGACNLPSKSQGEGLSLTAAAETIEALLSATPLVANTDTPLPATATLTFLPLPVLTNTPLPPPTSSCNVMQFWDDITYPDDTVVTPGQNFTKTWRLKNVGTCAWTPSYAFVFSSGNAMNGPATQALAGNVNPGAMVDISFNLTAPASPDTYSGEWKIRDSSDVLFGRFYVRIKVQAPAVATNTFTPVPAAFAVTNVTFNVTGTCPNFNYTYSVTTNGAGTVNLHRVFSDGGTDTAPVTMVFGAAGTQTSPSIIVYMSAPATTTWTDIYIDSPNPQQFGRASFTCP